MARRLYYTLITRESEGKPWTIQFGDYDRKVVAQESEDSYSKRGGGDYRSQDMKIITTTPDQVTITQTVDDLNAELTQAKDL